MKKHINKIIPIIGGIVIIFSIYILMRYTKIWDTMTTVFENIIIPTNCYEYLITDGKNYYLLNSQIPFDGITNPRKFTILADANQYLLENGCNSLPLINLISNKNISDPTDSYEKLCSLKVAKNKFNADICTNYAFGEDLNELSSKLNAIQNDINSNFDNYNG